MNEKQFFSDAYPPQEIARKVERLGVAKAHTDTLTLLVLAVLAGAFIAIGALFVTDKILAILFPITAFVAIGFEHSIANWFLLPFGLALDGQGAVPIVGAVRNIVAVTVGNIVGGTLLVAGVYWVAYLRGGRMRK